MSLAEFFLGKLIKARALRMQTLDFLRLIYGDILNEFYELTKH